MKMLIRYGLIGICATFTGSVFAQNQREVVRHDFSIRQCIYYAKINNVQVKNALLDLKIQEQTNKGITAMAYPQITGSAGTMHFPNVPVQVFPNFIAAATYGVLQTEGVKSGSGDPIKAPENFGYVQAAFGSKWTASAGVTLTQILFDGQVFIGLQARKTSLDFQKANIEVTEEAIRTNIYKIYYQLVVSKEQMVQLDANIERIDKLLHDVKALFKNGFVEQLDVNRISVQQANLQTEKLKIQAIIENGYLGLKYLMGMPAADELVLTDKITEEYIKSGIPDEGKYAYTDRKDYQLVSQADLLNKYNIKRYKYVYFPTIAATTQYTKQASRDKFNFFGKGDWFTSWYAGLNVSVPIFSGFAKDANLKKARLESEKTNNQLENLKLLIDNDAEQAKNKFRNSVLAFDAQKKNMLLAEQVYNQSKKKYESGLGSTTDITNAQSDLKVAQANYISALYDAVIAKVDYQKATGKL